ncbi:MAG: SMC-Scp complex subunit ScpB [Desulfobacterales bacterium]|nr:SMC-Scp complex subunit ScpB [Desulfobacterales bacterium]
MTETLKYIIESLLMVSDSPLTADRLLEVINTVELKDIREAIKELEAEYETREGGFFLTEVAGGYQLCTRPEYAEWVKRFVKPNPVRISKAALETLAIIAYKQPIIRNDVERVRGVDSGGVLRMLLERKLIRVLGRREIPGRPLIYATTKQFLELFNLKDLRDLPSPKEIESMSNIEIVTETFLPLDTESPDQATPTNLNKSESQEDPNRIKNENLRSEDPDIGTDVTSEDRHSEEIEFQDEHEYVAAQDLPEQMDIDSDSTETEASHEMTDIVEEEDVSDEDDNSVLSDETIACETDNSVEEAVSYEEKTLDLKEDKPI